MIKYIENSNYSIGRRTRDLPACSAVREPAGGIILVGSLC
jgi:hypothetical protein